MTPRTFCPALLGLSLLFLSAAPAWPGIAGNVDSLSGSATIKRACAEPRPLRVADQLNEGDLLTTGANSWVLLDMVDGATFTLRPDTQLRIDTYIYSESETSKNKSFLSLIQGAFRAVTGAIGTLNRPGYTITTPAATIGIRGTDHESAYYPPGAIEAGTEPGTYDKVNEGETFIRSARGEVRVRPGTVGFAHQRADRRPQVLASVPAFYRRHAEIDRPLAGRVKAIREKHRQKRLGLQKERAKAKPEGAQHTLEAQRAHREQIREERRKQKHEQEKAKKRQRREKEE